MIEKQQCVAFICVQNAGRSQMAAAFARRKVEEEDLPVEIISGGTDPEDSVHDVVVEAMNEKGFGLSSNKPRAVEPEELEGCDYVITKISRGSPRACPGEESAGFCPAVNRGHNP